MATNSELSNLTNGLVSYWKLDGNSNDAVGTNNGVDTSVSYSGSGIIYSGASFNGATSYINLGDISVFNNTTNFSISVWIYPTSISGLQSILTKWTYQTQGGFTAFLDNAVIGFYLASSIAEAGGNGVYGGSVAINTWNHVVFVYDGTLSSNADKAKIYLNGVSSYSSSNGTIPSVTTNSTSNLNIGYFGGSLSRFFNGIIDEVGVWNRSLTPSEISIIYNGGIGLSFPFKNLIVPKRVLRFNNTGLQNGLVSYWKLDGNLLDSHGSNHGTGTVAYIDGKIKNSIHDSIVYCGTDTSLLMTTGLSLSLWFKTSTNYLNNYLCGRYNAAVNNNYDLRLSNNTIGLTLGITPFLIEASQVYSDNVWRHVVGTWDGVNAKIYIDGVLKNTVAISGTLVAQTSQFTINSVGGFGAISGDIDEVGVWNRGLTQTEVSQLYNVSMGNQYPFPRLLTNNLPTLKSTLENGIVGYWKLDGNSNDALNLNNATDTNITYSSGKIKEGAIFNGSTSKIVTSTYVGLPTGTSPVSLSCWFKTSYTGSLQFLFGIGSNGDGNRMCMYLDTSGRIRANCFDHEFITTYNVCDGNWHLAVLAFSGNTTSVSVTVDNLPTQTGTMGYIPSIVSGNVFIGTDSFLLPTTSYVLNGLIDDIGVWNRALTSTEIIQLYNNGIGLQYPFHNILSKGYNVKKQKLINNLVAYWKFDGNSNDSFSSNTGIDTSVSYVDGKINQCAYFNGTNSVVSIPYSGINGVGNSLSFSIWVKAVNTSDAIIAFKESTGGSGDYWFNSISGKFGCRVNGGFAFVQALNTYTVGEWYLLTLTWQTNGFGTSLLSFYVNGALQGTTGANVTITSSNNNLNFGSYILSQYWNGYIDESGLWSRALSADDVVELYYRGRGSSFPFVKSVSSVMNDLVTYHKLDGNSNDSIGNNNGTDLLLSYQSGKINQGAYFDGTGYVDDIGTVSTYSFMQNTGIFTINFWAKFDNYTVRPQYFMGSSPTTVQKGFYIGMGAGGNFEFTVLNGISSQFVYIIGAPGVITDNEWHMYSLVAHGEFCALYKDSIFQTFVYRANALTSGDSHDTLNFGRINNYGLSYLEGKLDEVGIWDVTLTEAEIVTLYNNGNGVSYDNYGKVLTTKKLLLDNYPGAFVGYSLRKLRERYDGPCVRIRRSSDNAEQDFGFSNDYLDTVAFSTFVGSGIGYIVTWYDQTGNGIDVSQGTALYQPYIRLNVLNGKAIVEFERNDSFPASTFLGSTDPLINSTLSGILKESSVFLPHRKTSDISFNSPFILNHPPNSYYSFVHMWVCTGGYFAERTDAGIQVSQAFSNDLSKWSLASSIYNNNLNFYINGTSSAAPIARTSGQLTLSELAVGGGSPSYCFDGQMLECVLYASDKTSLRSEIESNINEYYGLY